MNNCRCTGTVGCQCPPPDDLERRTREGRLTFTEAVAKLHGKHCDIIERHGVRLRLTNAGVLIAEYGGFPPLDANAFLADNWHMVRV